MMENPTLTCLDERRRQEVRRQGFNGLDYLEVWDDQDQRTLQVYFLDRVPPGLTEANVRITGGRRIKDIRVVDIRRCDPREPDLDDCLVVVVDKAGDFSTYKLCLVDLDEDGHPTDRPFPGLDPRYACLEFSFKAGCDTDLDCKSPPVCPPKKFEEPEINYLAKDYATFRQLILDRLALVMPDWKERHVPDLGIALVEVLAYVGDYLSYYQDAVATEAYLDTARQRISVRRHARLVDYHMHEGCNARAWVCVKTDTDCDLDPDSIYFITGQDLSLASTLISYDDLRNIPPGEYEVFEPLVWGPQNPISLRTAHNKIRFYTWGDAECCLPVGATTATLIDGTAQKVEIDPETGETQEQTAGQRSRPPKKPAAVPEEWVYQRELDLKKGDVLIFEEAIGPKTGNEADADPNRRHAVRLTDVKEVVDEVCRQPVLEITWAEEDALPFPLCISAIGPAPECELLTDISLAYGNVILVDHGRRVGPEALGNVPLETTQIECEAQERPSLPLEIAGRFGPHLRQTPLTFSQPLPEDPPAAGLLGQDPRQALPWIRLASHPDSAGEENVPSTPEPSVPENDQQDVTKGAAADPDPEPAGTPPGSEDVPDQTWLAQRDLLDSNIQDLHFVVEMDNERRAHLRFGDGELGARPEANTAFEATYRIGNGPSGNVGAETISHVVSRELLSGVSLTPRNPMPAQGGTKFESLAEVKLYAPYAFRRDLRRAITADDYAQIVMRDFERQVQRAAAALRWTGSWYEVLVAVDPRHEAEADQALLDEVAAHLYRYRRIGHDLAVKPARYVPLYIEMHVCVLPEFLRGHVKAALLELFSNRTLPDGRLGFFHPDNLTFGEGIFLSRLVALAQAVPGVESVAVTKLERLFEGPNGEVGDGVLSLGPLEVARLDNDPGFPENGLLKLNLEGGR